MVPRNPAVAAWRRRIALALLLGTLVSTFFALRANRKAVESEANADRAKDETSGALTRRPERPGTRKSSATAASMWRRSA